MHEPQKRVHGIKLPTFYCEIRAVWMLVVVILEQFTHQEQIEWEGIARVVAIVVILVAIFMAAPVDDCTVNRAHKKVQG